VTVKKYDDMLAVLRRYRHVTDKETDGQTSCNSVRAMRSIARKK